jgi:hypothetical protein
MWDEVLPTLLAVVVGAVAGAAGGYWSQSVLAKRTRRENWSDHSASAVADVNMLLTDIEPDSLLSTDPYGPHVEDTGHIGKVYLAGPRPRKKLGLLGCP